MQFVYLAQLVFLIIGPLVRLVFKVIGIGFITYTGSNLLLDQVRSYILGKFGAGSIVIQQILGLANVDVCINMFLAAVTTRMVLSGLDKIQDRRRKQVWNPPGRDYIDA